MKKSVAVAIYLLLFSNMYSALGEYVKPTPQEEELYNKLRADFEKLSISKKDVSDTLRSFSEPLVFSFSCNSDSIYNHVNMTVQTRLARFDNSLGRHEGTTTGGIYVWKCNIAIYGDKMIINCNNELMLNAEAILQPSEKNPEIKQIEDLVIFYHELLHGQLMIDAIKSNESWRHNTCNKSAQDDLDYSYSDAGHEIIMPLQTNFASKLIEGIGAIFKVEEISPADTTSGTFSKVIGNLYDYPQHVKSGLSVSARSYNVADMQITSQKNDIVISGTLSDKTKKGIIWIYIFGKSSPQGEPTQQSSDESSIPTWIRNNAKWWAEGTVGDTDFVQGIQFLIKEGILKIPSATDKTSSNKIPTWIKNNAKWWAEEMISDSDFVLGIQYLIKNGIVQIRQEQPVTNPVNLGFVKVNEDRFEKQQYQSIQVQITGKIDDFKTGTSVYLTIIRPDQSSFEIKGILTSRGEFTVPLLIDANSQSGRYSILAKYDNKEFGEAYFTVD